MTEFHQPFIKNLVFVGLVTIVSMISVRFFLNNYYKSYVNAHEFTSSQSQIIIDCDKIKSIKPISH
jgi:hypothetical protein